MSKLARKGLHVRHSRVQEWIDGSIVCSSVEEENDTGLLGCLHRSCLDVFQKLWGETLSTSQLKPRDKTVLREALARLHLCSPTFENVSLDSALDNADDLKTEILSLLGDMGMILVHKLATLSDSSSVQDAARELSTLLGKPQIAESITEDLQNYSQCSSTERGDCSSNTAVYGFIQDIDAYVGCLMDLLPTLERIELADQIGIGRKEVPASVTFQVSEPATFFISHILDKFKNTDRKLAERLGEANWQRHVRVRRQMAGTANPVEAIQRDEAVEMNEVTERNKVAVRNELAEWNEALIAKSIFVPQSLFHDSGLGSTMRAQSSYAVSAASHTSFVSSLADVDKGSLRVPPTPAEVEMGKPFQCDICGHTLSNIRNRVDWKIHVFADLHPYICTWPQCKDELVTFPTRKLWVDHEFNEHRFRRSWKCHSCGIVLSAPDDLKQHLTDKHDIILSHERMQAVLKAAVILSSNQTEDQHCPLCQEPLGLTRRVFATHLGRHMEEIALASLPKDADEDSDEECAKSPSTASSKHTSTEAGAISLLDPREHYRQHLMQQQERARELEARYQHQQQRPASPFLKASAARPSTIRALGPAKARTQERSHQKGAHSSKPGDPLDYFGHIEYSDHNRFFDPAELARNSDNAITNTASNNDQKGRDAND